MRPLVFVPGLKGSVLSAPNGEVRWLTGMQALGLSAPDLALPPEGPARDGLKATSVLDRITLLPGLWRSQVYGPFLHAMAEPFYPFAYDWRLPQDEVGARLEAHVADVRALHGGARVLLVTHSNGGLVAWPLALRHPEWFSALVFAGVPFAGGVGFLPDLAVGTPNGINRRILRPAVVGTFPSVYAFFREDGRGLAGARFFDADFWETARWGIFHEPRPATAAREFLVAALAVALRFRRGLIPPAAGGPPRYVIRSRAFATLAEIGRRPDGKLDLAHAERRPGDRRVCADDTIPPGGDPDGIHEAPADHAALLNDPRAIAMIAGLRGG